MFSLPDTLVFHSTHGSAILIGCREDGYQIGGSMARGVGHVFFQRAVEGSARGIDFDKVHELVATIPGGANWVDLRCPVLDERDSRDGLTQSVDLDLPLLSSVRLADLNCELRTIWVMTYSHGKFSGESILEVRSWADVPVSWNTHLQKIHKVAALMELNASRSVPVEIQTILNHDDPGEGRGSHGEALAVGPRRSAIQAWSSEAEGYARPAVELVMFEDLGSEGLIRWIRLYEKYKRALTSLLGMSVWSSGIPAETTLVHAGAGLDALGLAILRHKDQKSSKSADSTPVELKLMRIVDDCLDSLPYSEEVAKDWVRDMSSAYNSLKHSLRVMPEHEVMVNVNRKCNIIVRAWVAKELGISPEHIKFSLRNDSFYGDVVVLD
ncbi:hypothetical protein EV380_2275 [Zhihengliuella halotolerans]|uniref:ApeA N-terminal domain-containing protein n=2 Tax=Zhihengliuella halotolerans TaxID=370736 RepID=A0A4Q8AG10_9MICC|nr:hypothetical protein EV380_2275 [Zhihengliuella halotolerans]